MKGHLRSVFALFVAVLLLTWAPYTGFVGMFGGETGAGPVGTAVADDVDGSFNETPMTVLRGEKATFEISHTDDAKLYIRNDSLNYLAKVEVSGGNGTDEITIDTYAATSPIAGNYISGGNAELIRPGKGLDRALPAGEYEMELRVGMQTVAFGTLIVEERPPVEMTVHSAPDEVTFDSDADRGIAVNESDIDELLSVSTQRQTVVRGEYAVVSFDTPGLGRVLDPDNLDGEKDSNGIRVHFENLLEPEDAPTKFRRGQDNYRGSFNATNNSATTIIWDHETDQLVVAWNTENVKLVDGKRRFNVSVSIEEEYNNFVVEDSLETHQQFSVVEPNITLDTKDRLTIYPWDSRTVPLEGSTNLSPQHTIVFWVVTYDPKRQLRRTPVTVEDDGTFATTLDMRGFVTDERYTLAAYEYLHKSEWNIDLKTPAADLTVPNQTAENGQSVRVKNVSLSVGGFVVLTDSTGSVIGVSDYRWDGYQGPLTVQISPPQTGDISITATAHADRNRNEAFDSGTDSAIMENGNPVTDSAVLTIPASVDVPTTATPTSTTTTPASETTTISVESPPPITPETTSGEASLWAGIPVFSLFLAGLLLGWRRR